MICGRGFCCWLRSMCFRCQSPSAKDFRRVARYLLCTISLLFSMDGHTDRNGNRRQCGSRWLIRAIKQELPVYFVSRSCEFFLTNKENTMSGFNAVLARNTENAPKPVGPYCKPLLFRTTTILRPNCRSIRRAASSLPVASKSRPNSASRISRAS